MVKAKLPLILLDSDVVRHFIAGEQLLLLPKIFPKRFVMLDKVQVELCRSAKIKQTVENFLRVCKIPIISFPSNIDIIKEYARLKKSFGEGESACMAVARYEDKYIASSNLRDIKTYCDNNKIVYYTTMDLILIAFEREIINEADCDYFIYNVKSKGSILPCNTIAEYIKLKKRS